MAAWAIYLAAAAGGEMLVRTLGQRLGWDLSIRFASLVAFWWLFMTATVTVQLIALAWRSADPIGVAATTAAMIVLAGVAWLRLASCPGAALGRTLGTHVSLLGGTLLLIVNLRLEVWVARALGTTLAEAHARVPLWSVPVATLAFAVWTVGVALGTRRSAARRADEGSALER